MFFRFNHTLSPTRNWGAGLRFLFACSSMRNCDAAIVAAENCCASLLRFRDFSALRSGLDFGPGSPVLFAELVQRGIRVQ